MAWKYAGNSISKHVQKEDDSVNCLINESIMIVFGEQPQAFSRSAKYSSMLCPTSGPVDPPPQEIIVKKSYSVNFNDFFGNEKIIFQDKFGQFQHYACILICFIPILGASLEEPLFRVCYIYIKLRNMSVIRKEIASVFCRLDT